MRRLVFAISASMILAGCGTTVGDRGLSGAGIGAGVGLIGGPPGVLVGGVVGAGVGMITRPDQVNLGKPAWKS